MAEQLKGKRVLGERPAGAAGRRTCSVRLVARGRAQAQANPACAASACTTRACCRSTAGSSRSCSSASCCRWRSAPRRFRRASTCRPAACVLPNLMKGPPDKKKLIDPSTAHQMFGRAGRPQFDTQGFVFVLAHEDDVKILRWREKYDQIPEDTKDPGLLQGKEGAEEEDAHAPGEPAVLDRGPVPQAVRGAAGQAAQPRPVALAAAGLHARRLARGRPRSASWSASG